jgi:hypothetical protein
LVTRLRRSDDFFDLISGRFLREDPSSEGKLELFGMLRDARGVQVCREHLIYMLAHEKRALRATAALYCTRGEVPRMGPYLSAAFHSSPLQTTEDIQVRYLALDALASSEGMAAEPYILEGLADPSRRVRDHALGAAGRLGLTRALPTILSLLQSSSPEDPENVISPAVLALERLTGKSPPEGVRTLKAQRDWWLWTMRAHTGTPL